MSETHHMQPRVDYAKLAPKVIEAMYPWNDMSAIPGWNRLCSNW